MDARSEGTSEMYKKPYSLSPRLPFRFGHQILDHDDQETDICLSNLFLENITGVIFF